MIKMMKWCQKHKVPRLLKAIAASLLLLGTQLLATGVAEAALSDNEYTVFYHNDLLGSPKAVTDMKGRVLWFENSRPYGNSTGRRASDGQSFSDNALEAADTRIGYTGHTQDTGTGLVYMKARYYDPVIGRFYSNDPVGFTSENPMMFNRYAYANNNPYLYTDPDGREGQNYEDLAAEIKESGNSVYGGYLTVGKASSAGADIADSIATDPLTYVAGPAAKMGIAGLGFFGKLSTVFLTDFISRVQCRELD